MAAKPQDCTSDEADRALHVRRQALGAPWRRGITSQMASAWRHSRAAALPSDSYRHDSCSGRKRYYRAETLSDDLERTTQSGEAS